jgi:hypothetical protein
MTHLRKQMRRNSSAVTIAGVRLKAVSRLTGCRVHPSQSARPGATTESRHQHCRGSHFRTHPTSVFAHWYYSRNAAPGSLLKPRSACNPTTSSTHFSPDHPPTPHPESTKT